MINDFANRETFPVDGSQSPDANHKRTPATDSAATSVQPAEQYKVGPGRPPKEYQFKPGQSGNPKGAKRKATSLAPDLKRLFEQALRDKVTVKQGEKEFDLSMAEAGIRQLVAQFAKGDRHARRDVLNYAEKLGIDLIGSHRAAIEAALAPDHQAILNAYIERQINVLTPPGSSPILAPPELLDDDVTDKDH